MEQIISLWKTFSSPLVELNGRPISSVSIVLSFLVLLLAFWLSGFVTKYMDRWFKKWNLNGKAKTGLEKIIKYLSIFVGVALFVEILFGLSVLFKFWQFISTPLFELKGNKISITSVLAAVVIFGIAISLSKVAEAVVHKALRKTDLDHGIRGSIERFTRYGVLIVGILVTLDSLGVSLTSLAALGAMLMVGVGFGLQNITQNFISGLIILLERPVKKGDLVQVGESVGRIIDIHARSTLVQTRDDVAIIVPNSQFISEQVINKSYSGEKIREHVTIGVAYGSDVARVRQVLVEIAEAHNLVLSNPPPKVLFSDFGASSLDFDLCLWISNIWEKEGTLSDIRFEIDRRFREEDISIPFPQRDVHIINQGKGLI